MIIIGKRSFIKKIDILIIIIILAAAGGLSYGQSSAQGGNAEIICELYVDNKPRRQINISNDGEITVPGREHVVLTVKDHAVAFTKSDCPDRICIKTGYISRPGHMAVCLPNRISVKITSQKPDITAPDAIARQWW